MLASLVAPLALALQGAQATPPPRPAPEKVLVRVNGQAIKASDVEPYLWDWKAYEVVQELTTNRLVEQEAAKQGIQVTDAQVQARVADSLAKLKAVANGKSVEEILRERGGSRSRLALVTRTNLLLEGLVAKGFDPSSYVKVSTILVPIKSDTAADLADAANKANTAYQELKGGATWSATLAKFVDREDVRGNEGSIGWKNLTAFPDTAQKELKKLKPGGVTEPVQTSFGFQIFRLDATGGSGSETDKNQLKSLYMETAQRAILDRLRSQAKIESSFGPLKSAAVAPSGGE